MKKSEFLGQLCINLKDVPKQDLERIIDYYNEIIEDKIEAGETEESAVASVGDVKEIIAEALKDHVEIKPQKNVKNKRVLVYLLAGAPLWVPLLLASLCTVLAGYICVWAGVFSVAITEVALLVASPLWAIFAIITMFVSSVPLGFLELGIAIFGIGISLLVLPYVTRLVKHSVRMTKWSVLKIIKLIRGGVKNEG